VHVYEKNTDKSTVVCYQNLHCFSIYNFLRSRLNSETNPDGKLKFGTLLGIYRYGATCKKNCPLQRVWKISSPTFDFMNPCI